MGESRSKSNWRTKKNFENDPHREFVSRLIEQRDEGFGFVPLVGAGLSAPSGVPIIREVLQYLRRCTVMALGLDHPFAWHPGCDETSEAESGRSPTVCTLKFHEFRRWLPGRDEWPPFGAPQLYGRDTTNWHDRLTHVFQEMKKRMQLLGARGRTEYPEYELFQEALGACAEWRSLLIFLSRLKTVAPPKGQFLYRSDDGKVPWQDKMRVCITKGNQFEAGDFLVVLDVHNPEAMDGKTVDLGKIEQELTNPNPNYSWRRISPANQHLTLGAPDKEIVDTFFLGVVEDKQPTLGHKMLARLAGPLRINTALTTNFDVLLEKALEETGNRFVVFDVHVETGLPSYRNMHYCNSLVKLHGGRYGLRADYSLDRPPTDSDLRQFASYLAGEFISPEEWRKRGTASRINARRHLIVVGLSGSDPRISMMIKVAAERLAGLKIFWVAFSENDEQNARTLLCEAFGSEIRFQENCQLVRHHFPGLLFLRCYQGLTRSLPSDGAIFPSTPRLPVPPEFVPQEVKANGQTYCDLIRQAVKNCIGQFKHNPNVRRVVLMRGEHKRYLGASTGAARAFAQEMDAGRQCVWIDLDEIASCNDLFEVMWHSIARKAGIIDWMPVLLQTDKSNLNRRRVEDAQLHEIARMTNNPNRDWIIFLNGRSGAGANFLRDGRDYDDFRENFPNGWLDIPRKETISISSFPPDEAKTAHGEAVVSLLNRICGLECPNVTIVILCYEGPFVTFVREQMPTIPPPIQLDHHELLDPEGKEVETVDNILQLAREWINQDVADSEKRRNFLYALVLSNIVRYPASLWGQPFHFGDTKTSDIAEDVDAWLTELESRHIIRRKRGGFIWIHCDIRNRLRKEFVAYYQEKDQTRTADLHAGLAEWNQKLLLASDSPGAAFELVYHLCKQAVALIPIAAQNNLKTEDIINNALSAARRALETVRLSILSEGFSKSACRRLQYIRDVYVDEVEHCIEKEKENVTHELYQQVRFRLQQIRESSLRLNRLVAREAGENVVGFQRQRELRAWQFVASKFPGPYEKQREAVQEILTPFGTDQEFSGRELDAAQRKKLDEERRKQIKDIFSLRPDEPRADWLNSCNELGTLGVAIRSFEYSERCFHRIMDKLELSKLFWLLGVPAPRKKRRTEHRRPKTFSKLDCRNQDAIALASKTLATWLSQTLPSTAESMTKSATPIDSKQLQFQICQQLVKTFQRLLQLHNTYGRVVQTLENRSKENERTSLAERGERCFAQATCYGVLATKLANAISPDLIAQAQRESGSRLLAPRFDSNRWFDNIQRTKTLQSLAYAFRGDFQRALNSLNAAESALREAQHNEHSMERAIIDIHRVEVLTQQALGGEDCRLRSVRRELLNQAHTPISDDDPRCQFWLDSKPAESSDRPRFGELVRLLERRLSPSDIEVNQGNLRTSLSFIDDAWQTASRAEELLKRHRKNVWWTTWFFELKLKLVELRLFAAVFNRFSSGRFRSNADRENLPHIGLSTVPLGTPTVADMMLENADRMVRLDLFRLARISETYANCILALAFWRATPADSQPNSDKQERTNKQHGSEWAELGRRQQEMCNRLSVVQRSMESRLRRRRELDEIWPTTTLDDDVAIYVGYVLQHIEIVTAIAVQASWPHEDGTAHSSNPSLPVASSHSMAGAKKKKKEKNNKNIRKMRREK